MARRTKPAAGASVPVEAEPAPLGGRPVEGYSEAELTKAFEVVRHQAMILRVRSRIAAAALGMPQEECEPEPLRFRAVGDDARQVELDAEAAALRDAQTALDRRTARLDADAARLEDERQEMATRQRDVERGAAILADERERIELLRLEVEHGRSALDQAESELTRRMSGLERERDELDALKRELAAERRELVDLQKDATKRLGAIEARERKLHPAGAANHVETKRVAEREGELKAQHALLERERQALKDAEHAAHERFLARETELAATEAAVVRREVTVEHEARHLAEGRQQLADDRAAVGALQKGLNEAVAAVTAREDQLRAVESEYKDKLQRLDTRTVEIERQLAHIDEQRAAFEERAAGIEGDAEDLERARLELAGARTGLDELRRNLDERTAALEARAGELQRLESEYKEAFQHLREKEADFANAEEAANARHTKVEDGLAKRDAEISARAGTVDARMHELRGLEANQREARDRLRREEESFARRAKVVETAERALEAALAEHEEQRRIETEEHRGHLDELARARAALDDERRELEHAREAQAEAGAQIAGRYEQAEAELRSREVEVERTRAHLAAERQRLENEERLVAELRVSLDHDARANQAVKHELDERAAELARQARALAEHAAAATARQPEEPQRQETVSHEEGHARLRLTVDQLATLMERRAGEFPERIEEWQYYLVSLRSVATSDGRLPESVEYLVEDVFAPLLNAA
jgi:chromosome segregation ATPase